MMGQVTVRIKSSLFNDTAIVFKTPHRAVCLVAALGLSLGSFGLAQPVLSQDARNNLPPIYGLNTDLEEPRPLNAFETRVAELSLQWVDALNTLNMDALQRMASFPFYIEGNILTNEEDLARGLRQWFTVNAIPDYRDKSWAINNISFLDSTTWLGSSAGEADKEIFSQLGIEDSGYTLIMELQNPNDEFDRKLQAYYFRPVSGRPAVAGIWNFR
jgi:hypothetical protein